MRVAELQSGMLLKPVNGLNLVLLNEELHFRKEKKNKPVVTCQFAILKQNPARINLHPGPVIYLGSKFDDFVYDGVYKHHRILVGDTIAILSGYHVKNLCLAGEL